MYLMSLTNCCASFLVIKLFYLFVLVVFPFLITTTDAVTVTAGSQNHHEEFAESWTAWSTRHMSTLINFRSTTRPENKSKYVDEPPQHNEGWIQWGKRLACQQAKIECCLPPDIRMKTFARNLRSILDKELFGQHIAAEIVVNSIAAHLSGEPRRPLVLSFHGPSGSGKNYLAEHIAHALFKHGGNSRFYKHFSQAYDLYDKSEHMVPILRAKLQNDLISTVRRCQYALFVIDEVDLISPAVLEALVPFVDYPSVVGDLSFRKSIFILLNNGGSEIISTKALKTWEEGKPRENLTIQDFESILNFKNFNEKDNGFYRNKLISKNLIDYSVPFLPLERKHVKLCIDLEAQRQGVEGLNSKDIDATFQYWPKETPVFSASGCKKVERSVFLWKAKNNPSAEGHTEL